MKNKSKSSTPLSSTKSATEKSGGSSSSEKVLRFISDDLTLRAAAVNATQVVREMQTLQNTYPLATVAVGRAMVGALLMASQLKQGQQVGLYFRGNGGLGNVYAEAHFEGQVRGYTPRPLYLPADYENGLSLSEAIGQGTLSVSRQQPFQKQAHHGTVNLVSGEIGDDIAHYLHQSHQVRSLVSLGVYLDTYGKVQSAGGILLEVMPGVESEIVEKIQKNADELKGNVSELLLKGAQPRDLIASYFKGIPFSQLDHDYPVSYHCPCTQERVVQALETLGLEEVQSMIKEGEVTEVTCQICGRPYQISLEELKEIKERLYRDSLN